MPTWNCVETLWLPLGTYEVQRRGKVYRGVVVHTSGHVRVQCSRTYSLSTVREYHKITVLAQEDYEKGRCTFKSRR